MFYYGRKIHTNNLTLVSCNLCVIQINNATVVAVGPGTVNEKGEVIPCGIKLGDQVLLPEFGGTKVEVDSGVDMFLFREADLLGKWEI